MKKIILITALISYALQAADPSLDSQKKRYSYAIGVKMADLVKSDPALGGNIDIEAFSTAVRDVFSGQPLKLTEEEMTEARKQHFMALRKQTEAANLKQSEAFLAENAKKEGVKVLPSGLQYKVIKSGDGPSPKATDKVKVHYDGYLINGTKFDSSRDRGQPAVFNVGRVIKGFSEALQHMKVGDHWKIYIPPQLGYGNRGAGGRIGPNQALIFDLELLEILPAE